MGRKKKGDMSANKIRVSYTIDPGLVEKISLIAQAHNQKMSAVFEEAVENFIILVEEQEGIKEKPIEPKRTLLRRPNVESAPTHEV
jgi:hypothetical protein